MYDSIIMLFIFFQIAEKCPNKIFYKKSQQFCDSDSDLEIIQKKETFKVQKSKRFRKVRATIEDEKENELS